MFYCVEFEWPDRQYFKDLQRAKDLLWKLYWEEYREDDDDETIEFRREELNDCNYISGIGNIIPCSFEDE